MSDQPLRWVLPWRDLAAAGAAEDPTCALPHPWQSDTVEIVDGSRCRWKARKSSVLCEVEIVAGSREELAQIAHVIDANVHHN